MKEISDLASRIRKHLQEQGWITGKDHSTGLSVDMCISHILHDSEPLAEITNKFEKTIEGDILQEGMRVFDAGEFGSQGNFIVFEYIVEGMRLANTYGRPSCRSLQDLYSIRENAEKAARLVNNKSKESMA